MTKKQSPFNLFTRYSRQLKATPLTGLAKINEQHRSKERRPSHDIRRVL